MTALEILKSKGYKTVPESYYTRIKSWKTWYKGNVKDFHYFKVFNGQKQVECRRYTLGMAKKVAEDWANLLMNEKVKITLEGNKEQDFFDQVTKDNNFYVKANEAQEFKSALGTVAYVVRVDNAVVSKAGTISGTDDTKIKIDYVTAENIYPLAWENNKISECAFATRVTRGEDQYIYLQIHHKVNGKYDIENEIYKDNDDNLAKVRLSDVSGYEDIPEVIHTVSDKPQFIIDRPNIANNVDLTIPMGISVYANAIDSLKAVDIAFDSYINEFVLGKKRLIVKPEAQKDFDGNPVFDPNDTLFYVLPEDSSGSGPIQPIDMPLRTSEHNVAIQDMLNALSMKCGFGEDHYKFNAGTVQTATAIVSQNSSLFRAIKKHEIILEDVLVDLCRVILRLGNEYMSAGLNEDVKISIDFDDSIIEDKGTEFSRDLLMLEAGIMNQYEFRMKWMNEDENTAKKNLPNAAEMVTEQQDEVE